MPRGGKRKRDDEEQEKEETPRKLTKTEKRAAAIARAKAAMAEDKRKVEANLARKQGKSVPEEPSKPAKKKTRSTPVKGTPKRSTRMSRSQQSDEEMDDASVEEVKPAAAVKPQSKRASARATNKKSPPRNASRKKRTPYVPPVAAPPSPQDEDEEEDSDDDMPPPPMPNLEAQISQQVLANMAAMEDNKPTPYTRPPAAAFENAPEVDGDVVEEFVHDDNPIVIDEEYPEDTKKTIFTMRSLILAILGAFLAWVAMQDDTTSEVAGTAAYTEPPCFKDNVIVDQDTGIVNSCTDTGGVECPDGGTCKWGTLVECIGKHYEISENKDNCVLTLQSKEKVSAIEAVLEEKTLQGGCHLSLDEYPMVPYKEVQLANPLVIATDALEMSILENEFRVERSNGTTFIGLKSDYKLNIPVHCKAIGALASILDHFGNFVIAAIQFLLSMVFSILLELFKAYPMQSGGALVVLFVLRRILQYRSYRKQLAEDVSEIRQIAYDYLEDSPEQSHLVLHVRDHIVMNIYPKEKRKYLIKDVWPRVVPDFKADHRIKKTITLVGPGKQPRDSWQWVAAVSAKKKPYNIQ